METGQDTYSSNQVLSTSNLRGNFSSLGHDYINWLLYTNHFQQINKRKIIIQFMFSIIKIYNAMRNTQIRNGGL